MKTAIAMLAFVGLICAQDAEAKKKLIAIPDRLMLNLWRARALMMDVRVDQANVIIQQKEYLWRGSRGLDWDANAQRIETLKPTLAATEADYNKALEAVKAVCTEAKQSFDMKLYVEEKILRCATP